MPRSVWEAKAREHKAKMLTLMGGSTRHDHGNPVRGGREGGREGGEGWREGGRGPLKRMLISPLSIPLIIPPFFTLAQIFNFLFEVRHEKKRE